MDDVTIYSKKRNEHMMHLKQFFDRCKKYGISLNFKKSFFIVTKAKLLGFVVLKDVMTVKLERTKVIAKLT